MLEQIERIESTVIFKAFLIRIGFKNYDEYVKLFWNNIFKRKLTTDWCLETYPNLDY